FETRRAARVAPQPAGGVPSTRHSSTRWGWGRPSPGAPQPAGWTGRGALIREGLPSARIVERSGGADSVTGRWHRDWRERIAARRYAGACVRKPNPLLREASGGYAAAAARAARRASRRSRAPSTSV